MDISGDNNNDNVVDPMFFLPLETDAEADTFNANVIFQPETDVDGKGFAGVCNNNPRGSPCTSDLPPLSFSVVTE